MLNACLATSNGCHFNALVTVARHVLFIVKSSEYVKAHGQLDLIVEPGEGQDSQEAVEDRLRSIVLLLYSKKEVNEHAHPSAAKVALPTTEDMEVRDQRLANEYIHAFDVLLPLLKSC